jgi:hypothetical protein
LRKYGQNNWSESLFFLFFRFFLVSLKQPHYQLPLGKIRMTQPNELSLDSDSTQLVVASTAFNDCKLRDADFGPRAGD